MEWTFRLPVAAAAMMGVLSVAVPKVEASTIYVGLGGQNGISTNQGAIGSLNSATGAITVIGTPLPIHSISGLTFDNSGRLWGSTQIGGGTPQAQRFRPQ